MKAKGGLGNRMLCAATGLAYGLLTGRRVLVDWSDEAYSNAGENAFPRYFNCGQSDGDLEAISGRSIRPSVWIDHLDQSVSDMVHRYDPTKNKSFRILRKYSIDPGELGY